MFQTIVAVIVVAAILIGVPAVLIWSMVDHVKHGRGREQRSSGAAAVGNALQELDRLVARPSVEHVVEAETAPLRREDEDDGE
jgi:hypothetical protein